MLSGPRPEKIRLTLMPTEWYLNFSPDAALSLLFAQLCSELNLL
jgi:hypothetical protein